MNNKKITVIICLLFFAFISNSAFANRGDARLKACQSNIRVIQGAIEMYNTDNNNHMKHLDKEGLEILSKSHYLKEKLEKPETSCEYRSIGNLSNKGEGIVFCTYHGDLEQIVDCKYYNNYFGNNKYKKFSQSATDEDVRNNKEKIKSGAKTNSIYNIFSYFFGDRLLLFIILQITFIALLLFIIRSISIRKKVQQ